MCYCVLLSPCLAPRGGKLPPLLRANHRRFATTAWFNVGTGSFEESAAHDCHPRPGRCSVLFFPVTFGSACGCTAQTGFSSTSWSGRKRRQVEKPRRRQLFISSSQAAEDQEGQPAIGRDGGGEEVSGSLCQDNGI